MPSCAAWGKAGSVSSVIIKYFSNLMDENYKGQEENGSSPVWSFFHHKTLSLKVPNVEFNVSVDKMQLLIHTLKIRNEYIIAFR